MEPNDRKNPLMAQIRRMAALQQLHQMPDREMLAQFASQGNEAAFRALMERHGPMVLRVCKRVLGNDHDAEDAYQAVFFVLASKAGSQRWEESVATWLHGVAVNVAGRARRAAQRRRMHEQKAQPISGPVSEPGSSNPLADMTLRETYSLLDEEIARLPEKYRTPLIQCELMNRRQAEVALALDCSVRTIKNRVREAKALLLKRLASRGVALTGLLLSLMLSPGSEAATLPPVLAADTLQGVLLFVRGQGAVAGAKPTVVHLAGQTIQGMLIAKIRSRVIGIVLALVMAGGGVGAWQVILHKPDPANPSLAPLPANEAPAARAATPAARGKLDGPETPAPDAGPTTLVCGKVFDAAGHALPFATVTALVRRPFRPGEHGLRDEVVARGQADEQANFRLRVPAHFPTWFPERQVVLVAKARGHAPLTSIVRLTEQGATEVELRLMAAERVVRGRLLDPDGVAASGVRLRVIRLGDVARETVQGVPERDGQGLGWPAPVTSDAEGHFTLSGIDPEQGVWLQVEDDRYAPDAFGLRGTDKPAEVRLKPAQVLEGRVVAADTGKAVAGVKLTVRLPAPYFNPGRFTVQDYLGVSARVLPPGSLDGVSGADGRFRLRPPVGSITMLEVHPPADAPYLAVGKQVVWSEEVVLQRLALELLRGVVVRGRVMDEDGRPVVGASVLFNSPALGNPAFRSDVVQGPSRIVRAGKDGRFSLTVPAGPVRLMAHGPTHEYQAQALRFWSVLENNDKPKRWGWREPLPAERRFYAHAQEELKLTLAENPPEVRLRLVRGETVSGRVIGPDGESIKAAILLCGEKVSPLMNAIVLPLPVHEGRYELPGSVAGRVYPVFFLDAVNGWGAAVDLTAGRGAGPEVKLARCGSARVRLLDAKGRPLAGHGLLPALLTERSFSADKPPLERATDRHLSAVYDPRHYCYDPRHIDPVSNREGWLTLPALIPGARYVLQYTDVKGMPRLTQEFRVEPGEQLQLPDLTVRNRE